MQAVILAGGLGTRLRPVVADRPKALAPIARRPFLEYVIARLRASGVEELVLCVGYLAEQIRAHCGTGAAWGVRITYSVEETPLGTGGALKRAEPLLRDTALVLNGDTYFDFDLPALLAAHEERKKARAAVPRCRGAVKDVGTWARRHPGTASAASTPYLSRRTSCLGTLALTRAGDARRYGRVTLDEEGRIRRFQEKAEDDTRSPWISAGVYVLERGFLARIPTGRPVSLERETFPETCEAGGGLWGFPAEGFFVDIGTPEGYQILERHVRKAARSW